MTIFFHFDGQIIQAPATNHNAPVPAGAYMAMTERLPTDSVFKTRLKVTSEATGYAYMVRDKDDVLVLSGEFAVSPTYHEDFPSYTEGADKVNVYWLQYGYQYQAIQIGVARLETTIFLFHLPNTNAEAAGAPLLADVAATTFDKINKEVIFTTSVSQTRAYSVLQHLQSLAANADLLPAGQIFSTVLGNTFNLKNDWKMRFTAAPTGSWNISGGQVIFDFAGTTFSSFNYDSTLYFDDGADSSVFTFTNSSIPTVDVVSGYVGVGGIQITPTGTTQPPTNNSPTNITINAAQPVVTITGHPVGASIVIHDEDSADPQEKGTVLQRFDNAAASVQYTGTAGNLISISMYEPGYKIFERKYTVPAVDALFEIIPIVEDN